MPKSAAERQRALRQRRAAEKAAQAVTQPASARRVTRHETPDGSSPDIDMDAPLSLVPGTVARRHRLFVDAYLSNGLNGTAAYQEVYKQEDQTVAQKGASRLLREVTVAKLVREQQQALAAMHSLTRERLIERLMGIAFAM